MIYIELVGGLGNQLFQYAMGKSLARNNNDILKLDISFYANQTQRSYKLGFFNIDECFSTEDEIKPAKTDKRWKRYILQSLRLCTLGRTLCQIVERRFNYDGAVYGKKGDIYLRGFWQTEKYFLDIADEIRNDFSLKNDLSEPAKEILKTIENAENNTVSIHIRRGDYVSNEAANKLMGVLPISYYEKAIEILEDKFHKLSIFVFSDDIVWAKNNLKVPKKDLQEVFFVEGDNRDDYEDMYLMSRCRHHIIANSTFSWWGAWLGESSDSMIIAPANWFKDNAKDASDVVPDRWIKI